MSTTRLPELPELYAQTERAEVWALMHAYGIAVWKAAIQRAAQECELVNATTGECPEMALYCAFAIRSIPDPSATPQDQGGER